MKIDKIQPTAEALIEFAADGFEALGALCERAWHDRLDVIAEGPAAAVLGADSSRLAQSSLRFLDAGAMLPDAMQDVFPGCPLTFRLAEAIWLHLPRVHRAVLPAIDPKPPASDLLDRAWTRHAPAHSVRPSISLPLQPAWHFTLIASVRCEIQAIDQHWSLHQLALAWPDGTPDTHLDRELAYLGDGPCSSSIPWPEPQPDAVGAIVESGLRGVLDLQPIRRRQEQYLKRELARVDAYFNQSRLDLENRRARARQEAQTRFEERLAAARQEHARRRDDQVRRHEVFIYSHVDALLWVAEIAWAAAIRWTHDQEPREALQHYVPRLRRWLHPA